MEPFATLYRANSFWNATLPEGRIKPDMVLPRGEMNKIAAVQLEGGNLIADGLNRSGAALRIVCLICSRMP
jgi:hypothetical protein